MWYNFGVSHSFALSQGQVICAWPCSLVWTIENLHGTSLLHFSFKREGTQFLFWSPVLLPVSVLSPVSFSGMLLTEAQGDAVVLRPRAGAE